MPRPKKTAAPADLPQVDQYTHPQADRLNNPPVGLVSPELDKDQPRRTYAYDPHIDPQLQWAGKAEHTSFDVATVSLHVHERIDPATILANVRKERPAEAQGSLFDSPAENPPLRQAVEFYQHRQGWANRLVAGDSLLVMNSLLEKEAMRGQVQMVYFDPPYGIKYGSNFQPFVNKRDVKDGADADLTAEPEMIKAFRDTWELGIHSYLTYLRDRLLLARELLADSGSIFVQISDENVHRVRLIMDEVFGAENFIIIFTIQKTGGLSSDSVSSVADYLIQYSKDKKLSKRRNLFYERAKDRSLPVSYNYIELDGLNRSLTREEKQDPSLIPDKARLFQSVAMTSSHEYSRGKEPILIGNKTYLPGGRYWSTSPESIYKLFEMGRIFETSGSIRYKMYFDDFPVIPLSNIWTDLMGAGSPTYVVQTNEKVIQRCLLMTTDPGDLVLDITCGSGTTAVVAEQWGRRWLTCDTSRVALALAKQRLMTAVFDYYQLARPGEGVGSGFVYRTVPHVTLKSIANNEPPAQETLYDQPLVDKGRKRITGPFTVEAVPAPLVQPIDAPEPPPAPAAPNYAALDYSIARSGIAARLDQWRDALLRSGVRGRAGQHIHFSRFETLIGGEDLRYLHLRGETQPQPRNKNLIEPATDTMFDRGEQVVVSFGPEFAPLETRQVEMAVQEASKLVPRPTLLVFAAFQFDSEAAKDIDEFKGMTLLKVQMNADLFTDDLKKKPTKADLFWLIGQPDVQLHRMEGGQYRVAVRGFDYYDPVTGMLESGGVSKIAMWLLDTDYDGRSLYPQQVFFPMAGEKDGWARLGKSLRAVVDEEKLEAYRGTVSLPFGAGEFRQVAVKIVDDRGIESIKVVKL